MCIIPKSRNLCRPKFHNLQFRLQCQESELQVMGALHHCIAMISAQCPTVSVLPRLEHGLPSAKSPSKASERNRCASPRDPLCLTERSAGTRRVGTLCLGEWKPILRRDSADCSPRLDVPLGETCESVRSPFQLPTLFPPLRLFDHGQMAIWGQNVVPYSTIFATESRFARLHICTKQAKTATFHPSPRLKVTDKQTPRLAL